MFECAGGKARKRGGKGLKRRSGDKRGDKEAKDEKRRREEREEEEAGR